MDRINLRKKLLTELPVEAPPKVPKSLAAEALERRNDYESFYRELMALITRSGGRVLEVNQIMETAGASRVNRIVNLQLLFREDTI